MSLTLGILAHVDAGKTTLAEQILYQTNEIRTCGRVDHQNTFLDTHYIEKQRGITIFADQAHFNIKDKSFYLLDSPGHIDFSSEMERILQVIDYAVVVVSAVEGVQGHTKTILRLLDKHNIPKIFFINKIDREGSDVKKVSTDIEKYISNKLVNLDYYASKKDFNEDEIEQIAETDDDLLENFLSDNYDFNNWENNLFEGFLNNKLSISISGSALNGIGVNELLNILVKLKEKQYDNNNIIAKCYKIKYDSQNNRQVFLKVKNGSLKTKDEIRVFDYDNNKTCFQKINEIRKYNGGKYVTVSEIKKGEICAVTGLSCVCCGDTIGDEITKSSYNLVPMLITKLNWDDEKIHSKTMMQYLKKLEEEDPMLKIIWNEKLSEIHISIMGEIQLEILTQIIKERFDVDVTFGECKILYKETVCDEVIGYGHFEPLRHYAEVHIKISPNKNSEGITFSSDCSLDELSSNYQNLIKKHIFEKKHKGVLIGAELDDVKYTLVTGRAHLKHTEGGDFREATYRAIRQGLMRCKSKLLEPYYSFEIDIPQDLLGRVISDIQKYNGEFNSPEMYEDKCIILGKAPVSTFMNYYKEFISFTKGNGNISLNFMGYFDCHNQQEIIKQYDYNPERDLENTPDSVFCSHGAGFTVKWNDVEKYKHC